MVLSSKLGLPNFVRPRAQEATLPTDQPTEPNEPPADRRPGPHSVPMADLLASCAAAAAVSRPPQPPAPADARGAARPAGPAGKRRRRAA